MFSDRFSNFYITQAIKERATRSAFLVLHSPRALFIHEYLKLDFKFTIKVQFIGSVKIKMRSLVLCSLMLSSNILLVKCKDVETSITSDSSEASNNDTEVPMIIINNNNDTEHNANKTGSNSTITLGEPFGLKIETRPKRDSSTNESSTTSIIDSAVNKTEEGAKDDSSVNQTSTRIEESIQEMFLEPWGRAKRDTEEEDASLSNNSDAPVPDNSSESSQDQNLDEFFSDHDVTVEGDSVSDQSKQLDPERSSSTSEEDREERDIGESEENLEEGEYRYRTHPYWYRQPIIRRYWSSYERKPSRDFIKIPIFPGK